MTAHTTEQERAEFETWWISEGQFCRAGGGDYEKTFAYRAWLAARRAPAVQHGWILVPEEPTDEQIREAVKTVLQCTWTEAQDSHEFQTVWQESAATYYAMLAAAPQPPEAACNPSMQPELATKTAPVQLPEDAIRGVMGLVLNVACAGIDYGRATQTADGTALGRLHDAESAVESKLRTLLAAQQRKPLTNGQILDAFRGAKKVPTDHAGWVREQRIEHGRAIERAHGIQEQST